MEREMGGGIGMGKTCKLKDVSFQCMTKFTTKKKKKKKKIFSAPFEALNSAGISRFQGMWGPLSRLVWELGLSLGTALYIQTSLYIVR